MTLIGSGAKNHFDRLERLSSQRLTQSVGNALLSSGKEIEGDIRFNMNDGAISGPGHIPSAPGQSPLSDTHDLERSIRVTELVEVADYIQTTVAEGGPSAPYAAALEYGTSNMAERPHMRPATARARPKVRDSVISALNKTNRGK